AAAGDLAEHAVAGDGRQFGGGRVGTGLGCGGAGRPGGAVGGGGRVAGRAERPGRAEVGGGGWGRGGGRGRVGIVRLAHGRAPPSGSGRSSRSRGTATAVVGRAERLIGLRRRGGCDDNTAARFASPTGFR